MGMHKGYLQIGRRCCDMTGQRGMALITALVLLVIMTLLGITGVRTAVLEEKMSAASYDRNLAFQAAEAALRDGEAYVDGVASTVNYDVAGANTWGDWTDSSTGLASFPGNDPQYRAMFLGATFPCLDGGGSDPMNCKRYKVQAKSEAGAGRARVLLESLYGTE